MPGAWADSDIADKAVKSDNAPVDFKPWNRRIQLVLPCSTITIGFFERLATRRWRKNICRSLFSYMLFVYGDQWLRTVSKGGPKRHLADSSEASVRKRGRLAPELPRLKSTGGGGLCG